MRNELLLVVDRLVVRHGVRIGLVGFHGSVVPMTDRSDDAPHLTRRRFLIAQACMTGCGPFLAAEAVASTALEHPEWDMDEERTWDEWETRR